MSRWGNAGLQLRVRCERCGFDWLYAKKIPSMDRAKMLARNIRKAGSYLCLKCKSVGTVLELLDSEGHQLQRCAPYCSPASRLQWSPIERERQRGRA